MPRSASLFLFPDINVWVALSWERHIHHHVARQWFDGLEAASRLFFCRITQLGLLRLLTLAAMMGSEEVMSQTGAWRAYDLWMQDERVDYLDEPPGLEVHFRGLTRLPRAAPKDWSDSYLAAFAAVSRLTLVTFDRALQQKVRDCILILP